MSESGAIRPLSVRILEKEYFVACAPDERTDLLDSAELLTKRMREIRETGKIVGLDRIAVMAALNLAHELLKLRNREEHAERQTGHRVKALRERVDASLEHARQLDL